MFDRQRSSADSERSGASRASDTRKPQAKFRHERKARDGFRELLTELGEDGKIKASAAQPTLLARPPCTDHEHSCVCGIYGWMVDQEKYRERGIERSFDIA